MPVLKVIFLFRTGRVIYSKEFEENLPNEELMSPFISAIISFGRHSFDNSDLSTIHIGNNLLTVEKAFLENLEDILGILISTGIDDSTAHAILSEITEKFVIFLEDALISKKIDLSDFQKGRQPDLSGFDDIISNIIKWAHEKEFINYDLSISIPKRIIDIINWIFEADEDVAEIYKYTVSTLLEQLLMEYTYYDLEEKLKEKFNLSKKKN